MSADYLEVAIQLQQGSLPLRIEFRLTQDWTILFGVSGSGKTTILRAIQGLIRPDRGRIVQHPHQILCDLSQSQFLPAHRRKIRTAGQTPRLLPHKTVLQNIVFGANHRLEPAVLHALRDEVLHLFRATELAPKMPAELSGGESQRISLAQAVLSAATLEGTLLLLDEPFTGLDLSLREELIADLRSWLRARKIPVLSVTHDIGEAFLLNAEVIRIVNGRVSEQGPVQQILAEERRALLGYLGD